MQGTVDLVVTNRQGIHLNSASLIASTADRFEAAVRLHLRDLEADAKNVLDILQLAAGPMTRIELVADGPDAEEAAAAIARLFEERFGES